MWQSTLWLVHCIYSVHTHVKESGCWYSQCWYGQWAMVLRQTYSMSKGQCYLLFILNVLLLTPEYVSHIYWLFRSNSMYIILHKCYNWKLLKLPVIWSRIPYANLLLASIKLRALQDVFYHVSTVNSAVSWVTPWLIVIW